MEEGRGTGGTGEDTSIPGDPFPGSGPVSKGRGEGCLWESTSQPHLGGNEVDELPERGQEALLQLAAPEVLPD